MFPLLPRDPNYVLADATVARALLAPGELGDGGPDAFVRCDIHVAAGRVARVGRAGSLAGSGPGPQVALAGRLVLPRFVDIHTHIDKGQILPRTPGANGTHDAARATVGDDRLRNWSADDVRRRMDFNLRCAFAHGTGTLRTHIDSIGPQTAISWPVFAEVRAAWQGRMALQAVALFPVDFAVDDPEQFKATVATVARYGGVLGGLTFKGDPPDAKLDASLGHIFAAAAAHGLDVDFHADESSSPHARSLERIAAAALGTRFRGRVTVGHCCSLALQDEADRRRVIDRIGEARLAIVSLPMCNMYLQDRVSGRTPRWRGVAPLHELADAGVTAMVASDNTRDPFYAYGDLDMLEVFREATRILHFDHGARSWIDRLGPVPAGVMGIDGAGFIRTGGPADLVIVGARSLNELNSRPWSDRVVVVGGAPIDRMLPAYSELDDLTANA